MTNSVAPRIGAPCNTRITIGRRFEGPPGIVNGGYLAGRIGGRGPTRVVLARPVPVEHALTLVTERDTATLLDGERELLRTSPTEVPQPVNWTGSPADLDRLPAPDSIETKGTKT